MSGFPLRAGVGCALLQSLWSLGELARARGPAEVQALMPWVAWPRPSAFLMSSGRCCYFQPQGTLGRKVLEVSALRPVHTPKKENPAGG